MVDPHDRYTHAGKFTQKASKYLKWSLAGCPYVSEEHCSNSISDFLKLFVWILIPNRSSVSLESFEYLDLVHQLRIQWLTLDLRWNKLTATVQHKYILHFWQVYFSIQTKTTQWLRWNNLTTTERHSRAETHLCSDNVVKPTTQVNLVQFSSPNYFKRSNIFMQLASILQSIPNIPMQKKHWTTTHPWWEARWQMHWSETICLFLICVFISITLFFC